MARIGLVGGTFNPIHLGHLWLAQQALEAFSLERVLFVPNRQPPHKNGNLASGHHRYIMVCLALAQVPEFYPSRLELDSDAVSYTVDTLARLPEGDGYTFVTGADALMVQWRGLDGVLARLERLVVATRPGFPFHDLEQRLDAMNLAHRDRIARLDMPALEISASDIRKRVAQGRPIRFLVPPAVEDYIRKNGLYRHGQ